jgi:hypothetical protein
VAHRPHPSKLVAFIKRYRIAWAVITLALNAVALVLVVVVFPDVSNLWISIFVLFGAFTASATTLGDMLVNAEDSERDDVEAGTTEPGSDVGGTTPEPS